MPLVVSCPNVSCLPYRLLLPRDAGVYAGETSWVGVSCCTPPFWEKGVFWWLTSREVWAFVDHQHFQKQLFAKHLHLEMYVGSVVNYFYGMR